jgi:hypothetical protein
MSRRVPRRTVVFLLVERLDATGRRLPAVLAVATLLAFALVGAIPVLPVVLRRVTEHRGTVARRLGRALAMVLFWLGFNWSLMAIWGAVGFVPAWWALIVGVPLLQIPAGWLSYRVVFGDDHRTS